MKHPVIGVDPGGQTTGIVCLDEADNVTQAYLLTRQPEDTIEDYIRGVATNVGTARHRTPDAVLAIEDIVDPNPHLGITGLRGIIDCAQLLGHLRTLFDDVTIVRPARHGSKPLSAYPDMLVGKAERKGTGRFRHLRSAYDVARAGRLLSLRNERLHYEKGPA